jgi:hypothetical protein
MQAKRCESVAGPGHAAGPPGSAKSGFCVNRQDARELASAIASGRPWTDGLIQNCDWLPVSIEPDCLIRGIIDDEGADALAIVLAVLLQSHC